MAQSRNSIDFLDLPEEILGNIIRLADCKTRVSLSACNKYLNGLIYSSYFTDCTFVFNDPRPSQIDSAINVVKRIGRYLQTCDITIGDYEHDFYFLFAKFFLTLDENNSDNLKELSITPRVDCFRNFAIAFPTVLTRVTRLKLTVEFLYEVYETDSPLENAARHLSHLKQLTVLEARQSLLPNFIRDISKMKDLIHLKLCVRFQSEDVDEGEIEEVQDNEIQELGRNLTQLKSFEMLYYHPTVSHPIISIVKHIDTLAMIHFHNVEVSVEFIQDLLRARHGSQSDSILTVYTGGLKPEAAEVNLSIWM